VTLEITLPIKPISYNAYYRNSRTGKRIKTGKGHAFDEELGYLLEVHAEALVRFGRFFDPSKNIVKMIMDVGNPKYYLKDKSRVSKTAGDVDNYLKVTQDKMFGVMGVDDYSCRHVEVMDYHCETEQMHISLSIESQRPQR
jgi:Holliday junction resolvase RusA-like endonuclease